MDEELIIKIDITDWRDTLLQTEEPITNEEDIIKALSAGKQTGVVARATAVSRALKLAPEDILRSDKLLYYTGCVGDISAIAKKNKRVVEVENGDHYTVPELIGYPGRRKEIEEGEVQPEEGYQSYITIDDPQAAEYAKNYLIKVLPGHIWNRLLILHECNEDVSEAGELMKDKIDEMVKRITEPSTA